MGGWLRISGYATGGFEVTADRAAHLNEKLAACSNSSAKILLKVTGLLDLRLGTRGPRISVYESASQTT